jgi:hypothetical protein
MDVQTEWHRKRNGVVAGAGNKSVTVERRKGGGGSFGLVGVLTPLPFACRYGRRTCVQTTR